MINWGIKFFLAKLGQMIIKLDIGSKQRTVKLAFILPVLLLAIISMANCGQFAKPTHQLSLEQKYPGNLVVLPKKPYLAMLMTKIRNCETVRSDFIFYSEAILRLLIEECIQH